MYELAYFHANPKAEVGPFLDWLQLIVDSIWYPMNLPLS